MPDNNDPFRAYNFKLVIQGVAEGHFTECSGLGVKVDSIQYREAGNNQVIRHIPGQAEFSAVTFHYGVTDSHDLWDWMMTAVNGQVERKNVSVLLLDSQGVAEVVRWDLINAWPSEWQGAALNALNHEVAIESLTLVYETINRS
jgi:phage tail-like protein